MALVEDLAPISDAVIPQLLELNHLSRSWVGSLTPNGVRTRLGLGANVLVAGDPIRLACIAIDSGTGWSNPVYQWFSDQFRSFVFIDRVLVRESERRRGLASAAYDAVAMKSTHDLMAACVKSSPPNLASISFHQSMGFIKVGIGRPLGDETEVVYMVRRLESVSQR